MDRGLTPHSPDSWFETDSSGILLTLHWEHCPLPLQIGNSVAPLFEEAPHQLTFLFSQLKQHRQVSFALPYRGQLLLFNCQENQQKNLRWEMESAIPADAYSGRSEETSQIRECVAAMDNCLNYLLENSLESSFEQSMANNALNRCQLLMKHCLNMERYTQLIHGEFQPNWQQINLRGFLNYLSQELARDPRCRQVKILTSRENICITSDPDALLEILLNILTNSLAFSPSDASVTLRLEEQEEFALIRITDEGNGLPESNVSQAITPYFSRKQETGQRAGLGLGLTNAYLLSRALGGKILITSKENHGTTVLLRFPLCREETKSSDAMGGRNYGNFIKRGHFDTLQVFLSALGPLHEEEFTDL